MIAIGSIAAAFMYNELLQLVEVAYPVFEDRAAFFANLEISVSVLSWLFQGFVVAWLIRRFELQGALATIPIVALLSFVALTVAPLLVVLAVGQVARRAGEYGIAKPSREVLFTIVDAETKYKAKNFIDTVLQRGSDVVGVWMYLLCRAACARLICRRRSTAWFRHRSLDLVFAFERRPQALPEPAAVA